MKKLINLMLCVMLVVTMIPATALADDGPGYDWQRLTSNIPAGITVAEGDQVYKLVPGSDGYFEIFGNFTISDSNNWYVVADAYAEETNGSFTFASNGTDSQYDTNQNRYYIVFENSDSSNASTLAMFEAGKTYYIVIKSTGVTVRDVNIAYLKVKNLAIAEVAGGRVYNADAYGHWKAFPDRVSKPNPIKIHQIWEGMYIDCTFVDIETNEGYTFTGLAVGNDIDGYRMVSYGNENQGDFIRTYINFNSVNEGDVITPIFTYNGTSGGSSTVEKRTVFSDEPLLNADGTPKVQLNNNLVSSGIEVTLSAEDTTPMKRTRYVYVGTYTDEGLTALTPVTDGLKVQYLMSVTDNGPIFDPETKGITVVKCTETGSYAAGNDCRYSFEINSTAYDGFSAGQRYYDVRPANMNNVGNAGISISLPGGDSGESGGEGGGPSVNPPGSLFWALVPDGADPTAAPSGNIEWRSDVLDVTADGKASDNNVNIYLAFPNGDSMDLVTADPSRLSHDSSNSFELTKNGYIYTINPGSALKNDWIGISLPGGPSFEMGVRIGDGSGLIVNDNDINTSYANGDTIYVAECGGLNLDIYYNGILNNGTWAFASGDKDICSPGVSPDGRCMEVYPSKNAVAGQTCNATLYYGGRLNQDGDVEGAIAIATFTIEITPTVKLQAEDGSWIMPGDTIGGTQAQSFQLYFGGTKITDSSKYNVSVGGNTVCDLTGNSSGLVTFTPVGNGSSTINVSYASAENKKEYVYFTWCTDGFEASTCTVKMVFNNKSILPGEKITLRPNTSYTGIFEFNGNPITSDDYGFGIYGNGESVSVNNDGVFTITTGNSTGYKTVEFIYTDQNQKQYIALFNIQVQNPRAYVLQFNFFEKVEELYKAGGYATIGIFDKQYEEWYVKYVVTDEEMRPVGDGHFVNLTGNDIKVGYYDKSKRKYEFINTEDSPFTFTPVSGQNRMMKITYDRSKDVHGPAYIFLYEDYKNDPYLALDSPQTPAETAIFVWTKTVTSVVSCDDLEQLSGGSHWMYDGRSTLPGDFSGKKSDYNVVDVSMIMDANLFGNDEYQVEIIDDATVMELQTDLGIYELDDTVLEKIEAAPGDVTFSIVDVDIEDEIYAPVADALDDATEVIDLSLEYAGGKISDFGDGKVTVTLDYELKDTDKLPSVYYVDSEGNEVKMKGSTYNASTGELTFETNHFSMFKIVETADGGPDDEDGGETGDGNTGDSGNTGSTGGIISGGGYVPAANPLTTAKSEASKAVTSYVDAAQYGETEAAEIAAILDQAKKDIEAAKTAEEIKAVEDAAKAEIDKIETAAEMALIAEVESLKFKARSKMTKLNGKKAVKVTWNNPEGMEFDGFDIYRSMKKNSGYGKKPFYTSKSNYYINNKSLKTGKTYYYKVRGFKYVNDEKVYTKWSWKAWRTI